MNKYLKEKLDEDISTIIRAYMKNFKENLDRFREDKDVDWGLWDSEWDLREDHVKDCSKEINKLLDKIL